MLQRIARALELVTAGVVGAVFASFIAIAWTGPTSAPPNGNVAAPINVGTIDQVKDGGLAVNTLAVFGNAILSGTSRYLNFGTTTGSSGYGIRDNAGTMEFKNSNGTWRGILPSTGVTSITFADGTTQTTAASGDGAMQQTTVSCTTSKSGGATCTTASCPSGYVRSGCSAYRGGDAVTAGARPSGSAACQCANQYVGSAATTCYAYCVRWIAN